MAAPAPSPAPRPGEYVGLTVGSAALLVGAFVTAWLVRGAFGDAHRTAGWVVACAIVALLLHPLVRAAERVLPRVLAVVAVLLFVLGVVALVGLGVMREVDTSLEELVVEIPRAASEIEETSSWARDIRLAQRADDFADDLEEAVRGDALARAADTAPTYVVTGILMLFLLTGGQRYIDGLADQFAEPRRTRFKRIVRVTGGRARQWMFGSILVGIAVGVLVGVVSWWLDLPAAVSLGVLAGVAAIIPIVGVMVGGSAAVLLAFGFEGRTAGVTMLVVVVAAQAMDALVVRRWIETRSVRIGATIPVLCAVLGYELYRIGGAVYGVALGVLGVSLLVTVTSDDRGEPKPEAEPEVAPATAI